MICRMSCTNPPTLPRIRNTIFSQMRAGIAGQAQYPMRYPTKVEAGSNSARPLYSAYEAAGLLRRGTILV